MGIFIEEVRGYLAGNESVVVGLLGGKTLACEEEVECFGGAEDARAGSGCHRRLG